MRTPPLPLLAALLVSVAADPAPAAESTAAASYYGKWADSTYFSPLVLDLSLAAIDAIPAIGERLPSLAEAPGDVLLEVVDAAPDDDADAAPVLGLTVRPFAIDPAAPRRVRFYAEPFYAETVDTFREAARGVAEAIVGIRIGDPAAVPSWLLDGLGQWVVEEDGAPNVPTYGWHLTAEELVPGLDVAPWSPWRRFEDRMAIDTLIRLAGEDAPDRLVAALARGDATRSAIEVLVAGSWDEFVEQARGDARAAVERRRNEASAPLLDGWAAARRGDWLEALELAQRVIGQEDRTLHPEALWLGARALNELGNPSEARKPIEHFFHLLPKGSDVGRALLGEAAPPTGHLLGRMLFERARAEHALGDEDAATKSVDQMLRRSPDGEWIEAARRLRAG